MTDQNEVQSIQIVAPTTVTAKKAERKSLRRPPAAAVKTILKTAEIAGASEVKAKPKATPKTPEKTAEKPKFDARTLGKGKGLYVLDQTSRPGSGPMLLAHTHAALTILGLIDVARPVVPKSQLLTLIGQRAVDYHTKKGNLESAPNHGIRLSTLGLNVFSGRMREGKINVEAANAYVAAILDGKPNPLIHVTKSSLYAVAF